VQSNDQYDGFGDEELSFPSGVYIKVLRKDSRKLKIIDGEDWWEGVYNNKIGYFPSIFVDQLKNYF